MNDKTLTDLGVNIKEIYLNRIVDRTTGEVIQEFKPPYLWWKEGDSVFNPYEEVKLTKIKCHAGCFCGACENQSDDDSLKKQYSDTVMCIQENGKCVDIKRVVYREDIL